MDAKMRANFINAVAAGEKIPCPKCSTLNDADSRFCMTCGSPLAKPAAAEPAPAAPAAETVPFAPAAPKAEAVPFAPAAPKAEVVPFAPAAPKAEAVPFAPAAPKAEAVPFAPAAPKAEAVPFAPAAPVVPVVPRAPEPAAPEEISVFAKGLPAWDMVPPQVMVRRKRK